MKKEKVFSMCVTRRINGEENSKQRFFTTYEAAKVAMSMAVLELVLKEDRRERGRRCQQSTWKIHNLFDGVSLYRFEDASDEFEKVDIFVDEIEVEG